MIRPRQVFWHAVMDVVAFFGGFGSRLYLWAVGKAADATDWGPPLDGKTDERGEPW